MPISRPWPWTTTAAQRRSLLRLIIVATEEKVPLDELIEAWAADETGLQQQRLYRLADRLNSGVALPDAVEEVRGVLGDEEMLAIRFGAQSGTLAASLRDMLARTDDDRAAGAARWRKGFIYLWLLSAVAFVIVTFIQVKIVPALIQIFNEFDLSIPASLQWSIDFAAFVASYWYLFALAAIALFWLIFASWPGRRLRRRILGTLQPLRELRIADVLQKLSVATQAGRPISGALSTLARYHFDPVLRNELLFVRNEMEHGADVWQSMASRGLLTRPEVQVLETSERLGNRPWALHQLALVKRRHTERRFARWSQLVLPVIVLLMGAFVLLQAFGIFGALSGLIESLV
jgi:type II secretory pathway component PulF